MLAGMPQVAWGNAAHSLLERTLDDSANRRTILPEAFILTDELLQTSTRLIRDLRIDQTAIKRNLATYAPFAATERVLMAFVRAGGDRQHGHEILRELAMKAWSQICVGGSNPLQELVINHPEICGLLSKPQITDCFDLNAYTGIAPQRTIELAEQIDSKLAKL
jgi:adenylosuccinate lyase